jgi:hypothetical protein
VNDELERIWKEAVVLDRNTEEYHEISGSGHPVCRPRSELGSCGIQVELPAAVTTPSMTVSYEHSDKPIKEGEFVD